VMCINNNYILQKNADFKTRPAHQPGAHRPPSGLPNRSA